MIAKQITSDQARDFEFNSTLAIQGLSLALSYPIHQHNHKTAIISRDPLCSQGMVKPTYAFDYETPYAQQC